MTFSARNLLVGSSFSFATALALFGCKGDAPPEPESIHSENQTAVSATSATSASDLMGAMNTATASGDPKHGKFTMADATANLPGTDPLVATIDTSNGTMTCKLYDDKAPLTVANFIGLASGTRPWKDPIGGAWVTKPAYDGTTFHRIIKGFMIQGGDAKGNGSGEPGYVVKDEVWSGAKHDRAGLLCMANRGPNTNGAQFFITDAAAAHLDSGYTIFGECGPIATVHAIANVPVSGETPVSKVVINSVKISRVAPATLASLLAGSAPSAVKLADAGK